jgi:hypothetical protein
MPAMAPSSSRRALNVKVKYASSSKPWRVSGMCVRSTRQVPPVSSTWRIQGLISG